MSSNDVSGPYWAGMGLIFTALLMGACVELGWGVAAWTVLGVAVGVGALAALALAD